MHDEKELNDIARLAYIDLASNYDYLCSKSKYTDSKFTYEELLLARQDNTEIYEEFLQENDLQIYYNENSSGEKSIDYIVVGGEGGVRIEGDDLKSWQVVDIHDTNNDNGFYGCAVDTGDGNLVLSFRGSEVGAKGKTIDDWGINDAGLLIETPEELTPQHLEGIRWANDLNRAGFFKNCNSIALAGHSLGGNISEFMGMFYFSQYYPDKCTQVFNLDGPGENQLMMDYFMDNYKIMDGKMFLFKASGVGTIFHENASEYMESVRIAADKNGIDLSIIPEKYRDKLYDIILHGQRYWLFDEDGKSFIRIEESETTINCAKFFSSIDSLPFDAKKEMYQTLINAANQIIMSDGVDGVNINLFNTVLYVSSFKNQLFGDALSYLLPLKEIIPEDILKRYSNDLLIILTDPLNYGDVIMNAFVTNCVEIGIMNSDTADYIMKCFKNSNWYSAKIDFNSRYGIGATYSNENPNVYVDIEQLRILAGRIYNVNNRLNVLDERLKSLYWQFGIRGLWNLINADILTGSSWKLTKCQNYMNNVANTFERAENDVINLFK